MNPVESSDRIARRAAAVGARAERVEPERFIELLLSRRRLERIDRCGSDQHALRDVLTGRVFVVDGDELRATPR